MDIYRLLDLYKVAIDERRPFEGEMLTQLKDYYRIGLTWSSNALEGNTLTESETKVLIEDGLTIGGKPLRYTFEENGKVTISRARAHYVFPSDLMLVGAMNPCKCGYYGTDVPNHECQCTPLEVQRYRAKLSGPLLDRIDIQIEVP